MSANLEQLRQMRQAAQSSSGGESFEFDAKVRVTINQGQSGNSLLASSIVLEELGIRLTGFRMNYRDGRLVPFFPGGNQDQGGNRHVDIRVDNARAPFDLIVLANEAERVDPRTGRTYRARNNVQAISVNGGRLASVIVDHYLDALESGTLPISTHVQQDIEDLRESAVASEA